jgi:hypothetical protein
MSFSYFRDPRYQTERRLLFIGLPLVLLVGAGLGVGVVFLRPHLGRLGNLGSGQPEARNILQPIVKYAPKTPQMALNDARKAADEGDFERAAVLLDQVNPKAVRLADFVELSGRIKAATGFPEAARTEYARGLREDPSAHLHYWQAVLDRDAGDLSSAISHCDRALVMDRNHPLASNERLLLMLQLSKKEEVRSEITSLITDNRPKAQWLVGLAGIALEEGQVEEAVTLLTHARSVLDRSDYFQLLTHPLLARHQTNARLFPLFLRNSEAAAPGQN